MKPVEGSSSSLILSITRLRAVVVFDAISAAFQKEESVTKAAALLPSTFFDLKEDFHSDEVKIYFNSSLLERMLSTIVNGIVDLIFEGLKRFSFWETVKPLNSFSTVALFWANLTRLFALSNTLLMSSIAAIFSCMRPMQSDALTAQKSCMWILLIWLITENIQLVVEQVMTWTTFCCLNSSIRTSNKFCKGTLLPLISVMTSDKHDQPDNLQGNWPNIDRLYPPIHPSGWYSQC